MLCILENKAEAKALKASYLYQTSTIIGIILASFISTIVLNVDYNQYWRLCFIFCGFTMLIGCLLRKSDTISIKLPQSNKSIFKSLVYDLNTIWNNKLNILRISFAVGFSYMTYIIPFVFMNSLIPLITDISLETMMKFNTEFLIFDMIMILIIGHLTRKLHYLKILSITLILISLSIFPLWLFLNNASIWYVNFVRIWIIVLGVAFLAPLNCWLNNLFKTADKYMLVGIGSSIGSSLIGRLTPSICLMLWHITGSSLSIAIYITTISMITLWAVKMKTHHDIIT